MIKIRDERDFSNWFLKNYKKLGFDKIIRKDVGIFPDFIVLKGGIRKKIELEMKTSNFLLHKHPTNKVDYVICIKEDVKIRVPTIVVSNVKKIRFNQDTIFDYKRDVYRFVKKEKIVTSGEVSKKLNIHWATANKLLLELLIEKKVQRIKKEGVNLWLMN